MLLALCIVLTLTSACSGGDGAGVAGTRVGDDWWYVSRAQDPEFFRAAASFVVLSFHDDSRCVVGRDDLVVWPAGTEVDPETRTIHFASGISAHEGDKLLTGGGEAPAPAALDRCAVGSLDGHELAIWVDSPDVEVNPDLSP